MKKYPGQSDYGSKFTTCIGIVKNNADPAQHGRLQIYIPSVDSRNYELDDLAWASYISPFGGTTVDYKAGREQSTIPGVSAYGFWAIPKINAQVLCGFLEGEQNVRFWMGCLFMPELNRTMPSSIDPLLSEIDESGVYPQKTIGHLQENLTSAGLAPGSLHYKVRGGYERSLSHPSNKNKNKPTDNGYAPKPHEPDKADSQTICLTSPGRHYFVMSDVDEYCRIRLKTTEGSQIIFDDTNERIYISTAKGRNWIELDEGNGKIYVYSDSKVSIRAKNDINLYSDENINIVAGHRVNIKSETKSVNVEAAQDVRLLSSQADVMLTASRDIHLKTLNGPKASAAPEEQYCSSPTKGWVYHWAEKGGSGTSFIRFDSAQSIEGRALLNLNLTSKSSFNARSMDSSFNLQAGSDINIKGSALHHTVASTGLVAIDNDGVPSQIPVIAIGDAGGAAAAGTAQQVSTISVVDHMVRPDHESWVRDEDESKCKTPRNKKYQG